MKLKYISALAILIIGSSAFCASVYDLVELDKNEIVFNNSTRKISVFDPTPQTNSAGSIFPGGRGANQLVIYTPDFGDRTNTNEFGTEAVVQDNIVTRLSGANSLIPEDGVVISGHGNAKTWITKNIAIGTKIYINKTTGTIQAYTTSDSYMYEVQEKIAETKSMIDYYKGKTPNYDWKSPSNHIEEAKKYVKKAKKNINNQQNLKLYTQLALSEANKAMLSALPNISKEIKGVWIRPTQTSQNEIIQALDKMQKYGINNVFIETFYHGKTIFPSQTMQKYGFIVQNEQFNKFDPLKIWIDEAHKRNMKIHIWFQSFYVGNKVPIENNILAVEPQWGNKTLSDIKNSGPTRSKSEHNGYFLDPANPQVQEFLTQLVKEIICTYKPDGINLDYIRYPQAISKNESGSWGYTDYARENFKEIYGKDPAELRLNNSLWKDWENYRRENITNFVRKIGTIGKENKTYISTVIFPDIESALNTKQQDWRTWSKRGYVNGLTPLFLTYDSDMVAQMMKEIQTVTSSSTDIYAGLFVTFMGGSTEDLVRQIHETRRLKADGVILFDYAHTTEKYTSMLSNSAFKIKSTSSKTKCTKTKSKKRFLFFKK